jgi:chromosome segregation ATPase
MEEHEIINVLQLANSHHLELLQWKVEYLRNDIERLEVEKTKCNNHILNLNRIIDEFQGTLSMYESSLAQKRGEMTYMNQESGWYYNSGDLYPVAYTEPDTTSYFYSTTYTNE